MVDGVVDIPLTGQPWCADFGSKGDQNSRLRLCRFIAGPENRLAQVAVRAVLDDSPGRYNPLVLYGPSGTGKSHLARGLAGQWKARHPRQRVVCTTAVDFARELTDAIETQAIDDLHEKHRQAELLVFEDLGQLDAKRPQQLAAQEELIWTLDALVAERRPVVVTASAAPAQLPGIIRALQSRLVSGLTVPLVPPGYEARLAVLEEVARLQDMRIPGPVIQILAEGLSTTVPELLGALVRLEMSSPANGHPITPDVARAYLLQWSSSRQPGVREVARLTARYFSLTLSDLRSPSRCRALVTARSVAMYLARLLTGQSLQQIGHYFGGRDHTTVMHACRKTERVLRSDQAIRQAIEHLRRKWQSR